MRELVDQFRYSLNMRPVECLSSYWGMNTEGWSRSLTVKFYRVFLEKTRSLSNVLKRVQMEADSLFKFLLGLWDRATVCSRAKFLTIRYPSSTLFAELKSNGNITFCWHVLPSLSAGVVFNAFKRPNIYYTTICQ